VLREPFAGNDFETVSCPLGFLDLLFLSILTRINTGG